MQPRTAVLLLFVIAVAALRLASFSGYGPLTLLTPLGAMALFGGAYFRGPVKPFVLPLLTLFISDVIVSFTIFPELRSGLLYEGWYWTYLAFAGMVLAGKLLLRKVSVAHVLLAAATATLIHWLVSDIGMCVADNQLSMTVYLQRLQSAMPYELRFFAGTLVYSGILFGLFELMQRKYPHFQLS